MTGELDVSVIVTSEGGAGWLGSCLDSLCSQTLASRRYEIVLVQHGVEDGTSSVVAAVRCDYPEVRLAHLIAPNTTRAAAKNLGLAAGRGTFVVFVHDEDSVSPDYLSALLECSAVDRVAVGLLVDIRKAGDPPRIDTSGLRRQLALAGRTVPLRRLPVALGYGPAKMLPRDQAAAVGFDADLTFGEDAVFWARLALHTSVELAICRPAANAVYYRVTGLNRRLPRRDPYTLLEAVTRVMRLAMSSETELAVRHALVGEETAALNRYLRAHPEDHRHVITERRGRGLTCISLAQLNRGVARDLAILYTAVPYVDTSANVAARRVLVSERLVDVLSSDMSARLRQDLSSEMIWAEFVDQRYQTETAPADIWWPGILDFCRKGMARILVWERAKGPYRTVYSRTMHPGSHVLAAWYKIRHPAVEWTAEFSDPIVHNVLGEERQSTGRTDPALLTEFADALRSRGAAVPADENMHVWIEALTYALADRVTFTNARQMEYMLHRFFDRASAERARHRAVVSAHPTLPSRFYSLVPVDYPMSAEFANIGYFGAFYVTRGLTDVVAALHALSPEVRERLRLHVFTPKPEELRAEAAAAGLGSVVVANAYVDYLAYLNLTTRFDVLLVNDAQTRNTHDRNPYLPSKYSDYRGASRPIWGVVEPGSTLSDLPLAYRSEIGDVEGARDQLVQIGSRFAGSPL